MTLTNCPNCGAPLEAFFKTFMTKLTDRERTILKAHTFAQPGKKKTYRQLGLALGISGQRVAQIEKRALEKMTEELVNL